MPCLEAAAQTGRLDVTTFVVLGEGLAAGMADFTLKETYQTRSFPALLAQQMKTAFPQPLIQPPGIGNAVGFSELPAAIPGKQQTTVRKGFPPGLFIFNLSVPGFRVSDAIRARPARPLVQSDNPRQTMINMTLGYPALLLDKTVPLWTQLEYAQQMRPTMVLIELGYYDVLDAAVRGNASLLPDVAAFRSDYAQILNELKGTFADIIVTTIPDPFDTAYFTSPAAATRLLGAPESVLVRLYNLRSGDLFTVPGIMAVGSQIQKRSILPLAAGEVLDQQTADQIRARVRALNSEINTLAQQNGAVVFDLNALFARFKSQGITIGNRPLSADYQGGIYSLNGYYPGMTGHAVIANELIGFLNRTFGSSFPLVDPAAALAEDPAVRAAPQRGKKYELEEWQQIFPQLLNPTEGEAQ
ncbi:MAG: hypothetical protein HY313_08015 [Acidobacteria bacterium]|nr:hypothetical protein [Acidobacteriota bacterium]